MSNKNVSNLPILNREMNDLLRYTQGSRAREIARCIMRRTPEKDSAGRYLWQPCGFVSGAHMRFVRRRIDWLCVPRDDWFGPYYGDFRLSREYAFVPVEDYEIEPCSWNY